MSDLYDYLVHHPEYLDAFKGVTVLGVAGTNGAGKDSLMDLLKTHNFIVYSTSDHLRDIAKAVHGSTKRGGNEAPMGLVGNAQRERYPGGVVELGLIDWWSRVGHMKKELQPAGLIIGSIRGIGEVERLHAIGGKLVVVDADREIRYERIMSRLREDEHGLSFDDFVREEEGEMAHGQTDPTKFAMAEVIKSADIVLQNNGSVEEFAQEAVRKLGLTT